MTLLALWLAASLKLWLYRGLWYYGDSGSNETGGGALLGQGVPWHPQDFIYIIYATHLFHIVHTCAQWPNFVLNELNDACSIPVSYFLIYFIFFCKRL